MHPPVILSPITRNVSVYIDVDWHTQSFVIASEGWMYFSCLFFFKLKEKKNQKENVYDQK